MTTDITDHGLAELLHLPQVQVRARAEQVGPGRQGGPLLVAIGIPLTGLALWGWAGDTLGWSVFALTALGAALTMTGVGLAAHTPLDQQPVVSAVSPRPGPDQAVRMRRRRATRRKVERSAFAGVEEIDHVAHAIDLIAWTQLIAFIASVNSPGARSTPSDTTSCTS